MDYVTSAGFLNGRSERDALGVRGGGPLVVVTNLGLLEPDEPGELQLTALHPGCRVEEVLANTGWDVKISPSLRVTPEPEESDLVLLREELDPRGIYLKGA